MGVSVKWWGQSVPGTSSHLVVWVKLAAVNVVVVAPEHGDQLTSVEGVHSHRASTRHKHKLRAAAARHCKLQPFTALVGDLPVIYLKRQMVCDVTNVVKLTHMWYVSLNINDSQPWTTWSCPILFSVTDFCSVPLFATESYTNLFIIPLWLLYYYVFLFI